MGVSMYMYIWLRNKDMKARTSIPRGAAKLARISSCHAGHGHISGSSISKHCLQQQQYGALVIRLLLPRLLGADYLPMIIPDTIQRLPVVSNSQAYFLRGLAKLFLVVLRETISAESPKGILGRCLIFCTRKL